MELSDWLSADTSLEKVTVRVDLHKKFRWFYTYYEYSEVYPMSFPFNKIPVDSFLTELEQSIVRDDGKAVYSPVSGAMIWKKDTAAYQYSPADSAVMKRIAQTCEEKMIRWMTASCVEEFLGILESDFPDHPATNEIRQKSVEFAAAIFRKVPFFSIDTLDVAMLVSTGDSLIHGNALGEMYTGRPEAFKPVKNKLEQLDFLDNDDSYHQHLTLPGAVFLSNADEISDGVMLWNFAPEFFLMKDYEMKATSRAPNYWIMILTGIAAILMTGILIIKHKK
jgi:hypothetical protein